MDAKIASVLLFVLALTGCSAPPEGTDPYLEEPFPVLTPRQVAAGELPDGYHLGDALYLDEPQVPGGQWRYRRSPADGLFFAKAVGRGGVTELVQVAFPAEVQLKLDAWVEATGVRALEPVAFMKVPETRDWMRLSQSHVSPLRFPAVLLNTDRPDLHLIVYQGRVDSVVWFRDAQSLARIEGASFREKLDELSTAIGASDLDRSRRACDALGQALAECKPAPAAVDGELAALRLKLEHLEAEYDAPILEQLRPLIASVDAAWGSADALRRVELWCAHSDALQSLSVRLRGPRSEKKYPARLQKELQSSLLAASAERDTALRCVMHRLAQTRKMPGGAEIAQQMSDAAILDRGASYAEVLPAMQRLSAPSSGISEPRAGFWCEHVLRGLQSDLSRAQQRGDQLAQRYLEQWSMTLRVWSQGKGPMQYPSAEMLQGMLNSFSSYGRLAALEERLAWIDSRRLMARNAAGQSDQLLQQDWGFLGEMQREACEPARREAAELEQQGFYARAALLYLQCAVATGEDWDVARQIAPALTASEKRTSDSARASAALAPYLASLLPPLHGSTSQATRLAQLLQEPPCADWPFVASLALVVDPAVSFAGTGSIGYAHLDRMDGNISLVERSTPQDPQIDALYWERLSGVSEETIKEHAWLKAEGTWLEAEKEEIDKEVATLEAWRLRMKAQTAEFQRRRANLPGSSQSVIDAFNRDAAAARKDLAEFQQRAAAVDHRSEARAQRAKVYNPRVAPYNERRMREVSAGSRQVDERLRNALLSDVRERVERLEASLRAQLTAGAACDAEIDAMRWFLGQGGTARRYTALDSKAEAHLHLLAIERNMTRQPTHEGVASLIVEQWKWSGKARVPQAEREAKFAEQARQFFLQRDITKLRAAVSAARPSATDHAILTKLLTQAEDRK